MASFHPKSNANSGQNSGQNSGDTILISHRRPSELSIVSLELPELPQLIDLLDR